MTTSRIIPGIYNQELAKQYFKSNDDPVLKFKFTVVDYNVVKIQLHQFETCTEARDYILANNSMPFAIFLNRTDGETQKLTDEEIRAIIHYEDPPSHCEHRIYKANKDMPTHLSHEDLDKLEAGLAGLRGNSLKGNSLKIKI